MLLLLLGQVLRAPLLLLLLTQRRRRRRGGGWEGATQCGPLRAARMAHSMKLLGRRGLTALQVGQDQQAGSVATGRVGQIKEGAAASPAVAGAQRHAPRTP
jgi:hypothetical protein